MFDVYQADLFAQGQPVISEDAIIRRRKLDHGSWIDIAARWLAGADTLLAALIDELAWKKGNRAMYGNLVAEPRLYASLTNATSRHVVLTDMSERLAVRYGPGITAGAASLYRNGRDSVAWHSDRIGWRLGEPVVAIVSLGGPRRFRLRRKGGGGTVGFQLGSGDLLVMGGACQHRWEHSVPKMAHAQPRISIAFRHITDDPGPAWWYQPVNPPR